MDYTSSDEKSFGRELALKTSKSKGLKLVTFHSWPSLVWFLLKIHSLVVARQKWRRSKNWSLLCSLLDSYCQVSQTHFIRNIDEERRSVGSESLFATRLCNICSGCEAIVYQFFKQSDRFVDQSWQLGLGWVHFAWGLLTIRIENRQWPFDSSQILQTCISKFI